MYVSFFHRSLTMSGLVLGIPPAVLQLVQSGLLERAFHDGLYPLLMYRNEAVQEQWAANSGTQLIMSRPGLLTPIITPSMPGVDPQPQTVSWEQWVATLNRYTGTIDTHMPSSAVANADLFLRNIHQLGLQAGQSLDLIPRNTLFSSYLSGQTCLIATASTTSPYIRVASLNGFTDVVISGGQNATVRPAPVSAATPLPITIWNGASSYTFNVIGFTPDNPSDLLGPGTLQLSTVAGVAFPGTSGGRCAVISSQAPTVIRAGGGNSVDAISSSDTFVLQDAINAVNRLRKNNVQPHEDGYYHANISTDGNSQVFTDTAFQRLNTALPDHSYYQEAFIGTISGISFFLNTQSPDYSNAGPYTTNAGATYASMIGAETTNVGGTNIGRILVTGRGALVESYLDESSYVSEAGVTGKTGEFTVVNAGVEVATDKIRLILRAPLNRTQDIVAATWSITTSFAVPSDVSSGGSQRYKRAIVIEHALD